MGTKTEKIYLEAFQANANQGILKSFQENILGAYNIEKKTFVLVQGTLLSDVSMPEELKGYRYNGNCGHIAIYIWDFSKYDEVSI